MRAGLEDQRLEQRAAEASPLPVGADCEPGDFAELLRIDLQRSACDDLPTGRRLRHDVLLDVAAQVVVRAWQEVAGRDEGGHQRLELGDVAEEGGTDRDPGERRRAHAKTSSRIATPRSSSACVITSGGIRRITSGPAVTTSRPRSRALATKGAAGSTSSSPHRSPHPRTSLTRGVTATSRSSRAPSHSPLRRTSARNAGSAMVRTTSSATLATRGPPPKVVAWSPGLSAAATALVTSTAPIGNPPASGFASVTMSGTTPVCS